MAESPGAPLNLLHLTLLTFLLRMEGESAADAGDPVSSDPYLDGTLESDLWLVGWTARSAQRRRIDPVMSVGTYQPEHRQPRPLAILHRPRCR